MPYKCLKCCKVFVHTAKKTETIHELQKQAMAVNIFTTELYVCPYCSSAEYEEYTKMQGEIVSVKSVDLTQVDEMLQQGYKVHELYAKNAVLIKHPPVVAEIQQVISHLPSAETEPVADDVSKISTYVERCKQEKRTLTDQEYDEAICFNWKLTCQDPTCRYFKNGIPYSAKDGDPCIECQTDFEEKPEEEEP